MTDVTSIDLVAKGEQPSAAGAVSVQSTPYDLTQDREKARRQIAYWLMGILTLVVGGVAGAAIANGTTDLTTWVSVFLTPIIGLVGTMLGFYFGGDSRPAPQP